MTDYKPLDIGPDCHDWLSALELAPLIGVEAEDSSAAAARVSTAAMKGYRCNDYAIERREIREDERDQYPRGKWLYRVKPEGVNVHLASNPQLEAAGLEPLNVRDEPAGCANCASVLAKYSEVEKAIVATESAADAEIERLRAQVEELQHGLKQAYQDIETLESLPRVATSDLEDAAWSILTGEICLSEAKPYLAKVLRSLR